MINKIFTFIFIWIFTIVQTKSQDIRITSLIASNSVKDSTFDIDKPIKLDFKSTNILIEFDDNSDSVSFSYRLIGLSKKWKIANKSKSVYFVNLLGGDYEFQVRNSNFPNKIAYVKFHIEEAFWQQGWFIPAIIGYLLLIAGIIFYFFQLSRFRQQERLQKVRNAISADLHDDIGSTLSNISFLTEIAKSRIKDKPQDVPLLLDKILTDSKEMVQTMRGMIWTINPTNDNATDYFLKVESLVKEVLLPHGIKVIFDLKIPDNSERPLRRTDPQRLSVEFQRNIFLVFKEATNNIMKYAQAKTVKITIRKEGDWLMMQIKDDGIGFEMDEENEGNGLRNMKNRIEQLGGNFEIKSDQGTRLRFSIPSL